MLLHVLICIHQKIKGNKKKKFIIVSFEIDERHNCYKTYFLSLF